LGLKEGEAILQKRSNPKGEEKESSQPQEKKRTQILLVLQERLQLPFSIAILQNNFAAHVESEQH
jgi:hypothetical protein